jgi:hypothetical protein
MRNKAIRDITAPFGVPTEVETYYIKCTLGTAIIWIVHIQCPSLSVSRDVYDALLVESARPESLSRFPLEYWRNTHQARAAPAA